MKPFVETILSVSALVKGTFLNSKKWAKVPPYFVPINGQLITEKFKITLNQFMKVWLVRWNKEDLNIKIDLKLGTASQTDIIGHDSVP